MPSARTCAALLVNLIYLDDQDLRDRPLIERSTAGKSPRDLAATHPCYVAGIAAFKRVSRWRKASFEFCGHYLSQRSREWLKVKASLGQRW
jgi:hypothetical protein